VLTITLPRHEATKPKRIEIKTPPCRVFVTHGEESAATVFGEFLSEKTGWHCVVTNYKKGVTLN